MSSKAKQLNGLRDRCALVLASSAGLGKAAAQALAAGGARLVITSSNRGRCEETAELIRSSSGVEVKAIVADMFEPASMDSLADQAEAAFGGIDVLVLNYPGPALGQAVGIDLRVLEQHFQAMVLSPLRLVSRCLDRMRQQKWGRIVSVGGRSMLAPLPNKIMDNTLRPALVGFSKSLANEVAADGVTVNFILPGTFMTERVKASTAVNAGLGGISIEEAMRRRIDGIPTGRFGRFEEFGALVAFLCSDEASYVTGSVIRVDGGQVESVY